MTTISTIAISVSSSILGMLTGGWFMYRRKKGAVTAQLASEEFSDVGEMVNNYTSQLAEMSNTITKLTLKMVKLEGEMAQLREENKVLRNHIEHLQS